LLNEGQVEGALNLVGLRSALKLAEIFSMDEKEQKEVGYKFNQPTEGGNATITWTKQDHVIQADLAEDDLSVLRELLAKKDKEKKFTMSEGVAILDLAEKIKKCRKKS
jgi:hypothetical protein